MDTLFAITTVFSAFLASVIFMELRRRFGPMVGFTNQPIAPLAALPAIAMLSVVQAPAPVLVGALLLSVAGWRYDRQPFSLTAACGVTAAAVVLGIYGMHVYPAFPLPLIAIVLACEAVWAGITVSASRAPRSMTLFSGVYTVALLPLIAAPLLSDAPDFIALDAAIPLAALLGVLVSAKGGERVGTGLSSPFVFLLGFLVLRTVSPSGWPFALASLVVWGAGASWTGKRDGHAA